MIWVGYGHMNENALYWYLDVSEVQYTVYMLKSTVL